MNYHHLLSFCPRGGMGGLPQGIYPLEFGTIVVKNLATTKQLCWLKLHQNWNVLL